MLLLVLVFPQGIAGSWQALWPHIRDKRRATTRGAA
jgi:hypothetical protein